MNAYFRSVYLLAMLALKALAEAGEAPVFLTSPTNQTVYVGDPITIECEALYDTETTFYFYPEYGGPFSNSVPTFYFSSAPGLLNTNHTRLLATNRFGTAVSEPFNLSVLPAVPGVEGPINLIWKLGETITLSNDVFSVEGKPPLTYSLYQNGLVIRKTTSSCLSLRV